jgi:DNA-binding CsgD family transcriptional regulator
MNFLDKFKSNGSGEKQGSATYAATDTVPEGHLSEKEDKVLNIIAGSSWPMTSRQVAKAARLDPSTTEILVENLEKKYLVKQTNI